MFRFNKYRYVSNRKIVKTSAKTFPKLTNTMQLGSTNYSLQDPVQLTGADPGFLEGGANLLFGQSFLKTDENKKIEPRASKILLCRFATA